MWLYMYIRITTIQFLRTIYSSWFTMIFHLMEITIYIVQFLNDQVIRKILIVQ